MNMISSSTDWTTSVALALPTPQPRQQVEKELMLLLGTRFRMPEELVGLMAKASYDAFIEASEGLAPMNAEALAFALSTEAGRQKLNELKLAAMSQLAKMCGEAVVPTVIVPALPAKGWTAAKPQKKPKVKVAPKLPTLEPGVQEHLTLLLRGAVQQYLDSGDQNRNTIIDEVMKEIVTTCYAAGVTEFTTPYCNSGRGNGGASGMLIGRVKTLRDAGRIPPFFLKWTENGPAGEMPMAKMLGRPTTTMKATGKTAPDAKQVREAQLAARRQRDRDARVKGPTGGGEKQKGGKKGKK
ncbi:MAG: hypothetical protein WC718_17515 [Phycisphaerales bacterium]